MKNQEQTRHPLTRPVAIVGFGALGIGLLLLATPRRAPDQATVQTPAPEVAQTTESAPATAAAAAPASDPQPGAPKQVPLQLGALKEKPEVIRAADCQLKDLKLTFRLDPRLTRSLYMGDRWVSPPTFTMTGAGQECTLEAKVQGVDEDGRLVEVNADWTPADVNMVTVSPGQGGAVEITVHGTGKTTLEVASLGLSKKLPLNALAHGETLVVEVYQQ